ncbi:hypothetical protein MKQ70_24140 [Chitinophaga sedimenti]|uniref:hypothetical protein n=1 Tax=Chitinophaga sedimenti TaxID=2033606 RepID=UPI00200528DE|nr:hypothetical protein [Chitinophaga sedimenti]MCK7557931.1 hypothetical protein [Chitinophaga sedimenti]
MSNSTLPLFITSHATTEKKNRHMNEMKKMQREEKALIAITADALKTIQYTPRTSTLDAIFEYAKKK